MSKRRYDKEYIDLSELGSMCGGTITLHGCTCGRYCEVMYNMPHNAYDEQTFTDDQGREVRVIVHACEACDLRITETICYVLNTENCTRTEHHTVIVRIGSTDVKEITFERTEEYHDMERSFVLSGDSCTDGLTVTEKCKNCDLEYSDQYGHHYTYEQWRIDLSKYGSECGGTVVRRGCPCGQEGRTDYNFPYDTHTENSYYDEENGREMHVSVRTCKACDLRLTDRYYYVHNTDNCTRTVYHTVTINVGETLVADFEYVEVEEYHDMTFETKLLGDTCEDGVTITEKCKYCDAGGSYTVYYHEEHEKERIDLSELGSTCGGYAVLRGCACGYRSFVSLDHSPCDMGSEFCEMWIENAVGGYQYTIGGYYQHFSNDAYLMTCAVTDPACAFKIRYAQYWLKAEDECKAYRYQTWQFGYDEETGEYQYEITFRTGSSRTYHDYEDQSTENCTKFVCGDCGSYYTEANYYDESGRHIKHEQIFSNTVKDGYDRYRETVREYVYDIYGNQNLSREYEKYISYDGTESWSERLYTPYDGPFGDNGHKVTSEEGNSDGWYIYRDYAYVHYCGSQFYIYEESREGDFWWRYDYTYSFEGECVRTTRFTDSSGENTTTDEPYCNAIYYVTIVKPTCTQEGIACHKCSICGKITNEFTEEAQDHSWVHASENWQYCFRCGLENANGVSGDIILEDLTERYGNGENYVVGYCVRSDVEFSQYVCLLLPDGQDVPLQSIEVLPVDGVRAFAFSKKAVEEAAAAQGYTDYLISFVFVPYGGDGSLDYAITFTDPSFTEEISDDVSFTDYVGEGETAEYTIKPKEDGFWLFTSYVNNNMQAMLYDENGNLLASDLYGSDGYNVRMIYELKANSTYVVKVKWNDEYYAGSMALLFNANVSVEDYASQDLLQFTSNGDGTCYVSGYNSWDQSVVVIPSTYNDEIVTGLGQGAFKGQGVYAVILPDTIMTIGEQAFNHCSGLTSIVIPDSVISIGDYAFSNCANLEYVTLSESVMSIGDNAFRNCYNLKHVTIPDSVTSIGKLAFFACNSLESVTIPVNVTSIGNEAFAGCNKLAQVTIAATVTNMGSYVFSNCPNLTTVTLTEGMTEIADCMFIGCDALTTVSIPASVTRIGNNAFESAGLTTLVIPDTVTEIGEYAFANCSDLVSLTIGKGVTSIGHEAFGNCGSLEEITVEDGNTAYHSAGNCLIRTEDKVLIRGCKNSVIMDGEVVGIQSYAFNGCSGLTSIAIPASVTWMNGYAFHNCPDLHTITVAEDNESFCSVDGVLYSKDMTQLILCPVGKETVDIPDGVTHIMEYAFYGCDKLTAVEISEGVTYIYSNAFGYCLGLTEITLPASLEYIQHNAFLGCNNLTSILVAEDNRNYCSVDGMLLSKDGTKLVCCPAGKQGMIVVPDTVVTIGVEAFWGCQHMTSLLIPTSVTTIEHNVFSGCHNLTDVCYTGTQEQWSEISRSSDFWHEETTLHFEYAREHVHTLPTNIPLWNEPQACTECGVMLRPGNGIVVHLAFDVLQLYSNGSVVRDVFYPGESWNWNGHLNLQNTTVDELRFFGWVSTKDAIGQFGYSFNGGTPVFDDAWTQEPEQGVLDMAASQGAYAASRVNIMIPLEGLEGSNTIQVLYKSATGEIVMLYEITTDITFNEAHEHTPGDAATCTTDQVCTECGDVLVKALGHSIIEHEGKPACTETGWDAYETCTRCDYSTYQEKASVGHQYFKPIKLPEPVVNFVVENSELYPFEVNGKEIRSTNKDHHSTSTYTITAMRDFELKLQYRISSEKGFDYLIIAHNGVEIVKVSGNGNWTNLSIDMKNGDTVTITYAKDQNKSVNEDCAFVKFLTEESTSTIYQLVVITEDQLENLQPICGQDLCCEVCKAVLAEKISHNFVDDVCTICGSNRQNAVPPVVFVPAADMVSSLPNGNGINSVELSADGNYVTLDTIGQGDPYYLLPMINQKGYVAQFVAIKYRTTSSLAQSEMFVGSGFGPSGMDDHIGFDLICDGEWHLAVIDLSQAPAVVDGVVNYLRWDAFTGSADATIDLGYIALFASAEDAIAYDEQLDGNYSGRLNVPIGS